MQRPNNEPALSFPVGELNVVAGNTNIKGHRKSVPECCGRCIHIIYEYDEWVGDLTYCNIGTWLPHKKQSCKRQQEKKINKGS